jgi:hypothetical protein
LRRNALIRLETGGPARQRYRPINFSLIFATLVCEQPGSIQMHQIRERKCAGRHPVYERRKKRGGEQNAEAAAHERQDEAFGDALASYQPCSSPPSESTE